MKSEQQLTFMEHIYELRNRLFWVVASLVVTSSIAFQYKDILVDFIVAPLHGEKLIYLTPGGGFSFIFTVCLYFGALITIPVIVYHLYRFLQPVLGKTSRKFILMIVSISTMLAAAGAVFGYVVAIPAAINFLTTFAGDAVSPSLTAESYLGFVVAYLLGLAILFQLPLLLFIFDHVRPFPPGTLLSSQRFVIAGAVIAAAVITPTPDIINQLIVSGPIIAIYELGVMIVYMRRRIERSRMKKQNKKQSQMPALASLVTETEPLIPQITKQQELPVSNMTSPTLKRRASIDGMTRKTVSGIVIPAQRNSVVGIVPKRPINGSASRPAQVHRSVDGLSSI